MICSTAVVRAANVPEDVHIGDFAVVAEGVVLGRGVVLHPHVVLAGGVTIGDGVEIFPGAFIGKEPKGAGALARTPVFERRVRIGANCSIGPHAVIYYDVEIGEGTLLGDGASVREKCRIGSRCIIARYVTINYDTIIGDRTKIMDLTHVTGKCRIGNDCFISLTVGMTNDNAIGAHGFREEEIRGPIIEDGVMIGAGATLLPGIRLGRGSIVGAGSVVTRDVAPATVVMGVPARFVRELR